VTNNSAPVAIGTVFLPYAPNMEIDYGALPSWTNLGANVFIGTSTNPAYMNLAVTNHFPSGTNYAIDQIPIAGIPVTVYAVVQFISYTNANAGAKAVFPNQ
jgi:hypothetical protein